MSFPARYSTECTRDCGRRIWPGDLIEGNGRDGYAHVACPAPTLDVDRPPCPRCFTVPATNGTCGCD